MLEGLSGLQVLLLLMGAAAAGFYIGRMSSRESHDQARHKRFEEAAAQGFARLSAAAQGEVDALVAAGKTIEAIKLIRAELNTGLYEAKQIVDLRKSREA